MMAKALGNVRGQTDIGGGQAMLIMHVTIMEATDSCLRARLRITVITDELGHRPRLLGRTKRTQAWKMADQSPHQLAFAFPKARQQFPLLLRSQQIGGEDRG